MSGSAFGLGRGARGREGAHLLEPERDLLPPRLLHPVVLYLRNIVVFRHVPILGCGRCARRQGVRSSRRGAPGERPGRGASVGGPGGGRAALPRPWKFDSDSGTRPFGCGRSRGTVQRLPGGIGVAPRGSPGHPGAVGGRRGAYLLPAHQIKSFQDAHELEGLATSRERLGRRILHRGLVGRDDLVALEAHHFYWGPPSAPPTPYPAALEIVSSVATADDFNFVESRSLLARSQ